MTGQKGKAPGKGGLVHIIDEWLEDKEDKSIAFVRESCDDIIQFARARYC